MSFLADDLTISGRLLNPIRLVPGALQSTGIALAAKSTFILEDVRIFKLNTFFHERTDWHNFPPPQSSKATQGFDAPTSKLTHQCHISLRGPFWGNTPTRRWALPILTLYIQFVELSGSHFLMDRLLSSMSDTKIPPTAFTSMLLHSSQSGDSFWRRHQNIAHLDPPASVRNKSYMGTPDSLRNSITLNRHTTHVERKVGSEIQVKR